ncbi:KEOPS complex subunit Pcc1 [Methanococcus aeolicus]|uniref:Uncharacterized protein n=1 Tax=Methanococcus aeolicus (strain ATCC BAA-1280 / DSM 17508 / OCM 812 / Nankai-3) TaxID=419665 RepID=A6UW11_META3|nr:KEOPS complex subunit Pcc1 [Methanococcus aeolicus]ABR56683.1 conserved hypothetical protein [Methanococcus aeolicus Nankai-3]UXM84685.1 KEOPS complex subunit Pcc1 [Methanococcus aeolicus]
MAEIYFKMELPSNENEVNSLKVDDMDDGLVIQTNYNHSTKNLILEIKTNSTGSLNNILDDYFVNYEMMLNIMDLTKNNVKVKKLNK